MGNIDSKPAAYDHEERSDTFLEFLRTGNNGQNNSDVLHRLLQSV